METPLAYELSGSGPPLLLLHGALVSSRMWQPQRAHLSQWYQVLTCDLPAHGGSPDVEGTYTVTAVSRRVRQLLDYLNIEQVHLCGHSLGGMVAQQLAVDHPRRVRKLILAETSFGTRNTLPERLQTLFARPFLWLTPQSALVQLSMRQYGVCNEGTAEFIQEEISEYTRATSLRVMGAAFRFAGKKQLPEISSPTLILVGEKNKQTHAQGRQMAQLIPDADFAIIPQAHHLLNLDNAEAFAEQVLAFLASE